MNTKLPPGKNAKKPVGKGAKQNQPELPPWATPVIKACSYTAWPSLAIAGLALIALLVLIGLRKTDLPFIKTLTGCFEFFCVLGFLALIAAKFQSRFPAWIAGLIGVIFATVQFMLAMIASAAEMHNAGPFVKNTASISINGIGMFLVIFSMVYLVTHYIVEYVSAQKKRRSKKLKYIDESNTDAMKRSFVPKCWELSRCRPHVRMTCPNYVERFTCWKRRSGCFCDTNLANYLVSMSGKGEAQEAVDMQNMANRAANRRDVFKHKEGTKRTWKEQQQFCFECPLYLEHQDYKYKNLSWISFPITICLMLAASPLFSIAYQYGINFVQEQLKSMKLGNFTPDVTGLGGSFEFLLLFVLGLLLWGYIISMVETCFLRWKW